MTPEEEQAAKDAEEAARVAAEEAAREEEESKEREAQTEGIFNRIREIVREEITAGKTPVKEKEAPKEDKPKTEEPKQKLPVVLKKNAFTRLFLGD